MRRKRDGACFVCGRVGSKISGTTLRTVNRTRNPRELVHLYAFRTNNRASLPTIRICSYCVRDIKDDVYPSKTIERPPTPLRTRPVRDSGVTGEGDS